MHDDERARLDVEPEWICLERRRDVAVDLRARDGLGVRLVELHVVRIKERDDFPRQLPAAVVAIPAAAKAAELPVLVKLLAAMARGEIVARAVNLEPAALADQARQRALYHGVAEQRVEPRDAAKQVVRVAEHVGRVRGQLRAVWIVHRIGVAADRLEQVRGAVRLTDVVPALQEGQDLGIAEQVARHCCGFKNSKIGWIGAALVSSRRAALLSHRQTGHFSCPCIIYT